MSKRVQSLPLPDAEDGREFYSRVVEMLEAGLIEILIRPTTPARRAAVAVARRDDAIREFLRERVTEAPKLTVTGAELRRAFVEWARGKGLPLPNDKSVRSGLKEAMKEIHGVAQRTDIYRNGTARRGWSGVCLFVPPTDGEEEDAS